MSRQKAIAQKSRVLAIREEVYEPALGSLSPSEQEEISRAAARLETINQIDRASALEILFAISNLLAASDGREQTT